jgi:hypothetical protein
MGFDSPKPPAAPPPPANAEAPVVEADAIAKRRRSKRVANSSTLNTVRAGSFNPAYQSGHKTMLGQ